MDAAEMISNDIASDGEVGGEAVADEVVADEEIVDEKTMNAGAVEQAVTEEVQKKGGKVDDARNGGGEKNWPGWPGECVFRILVPAPRVGGIIGKRGEVIKKMCEESKARIKILDGPHTLAHNSPERAVVC